MDLTRIHVVFGQKCKQVFRYSIGPFPEIRNLIRVLFVQSFPIVKSDRYFDHNIFFDIALHTSTIYHLMSDSLINQSLKRKWNCIRFQSIVISIALRSTIASYAISVNFIIKSHLYHWFAHIMICAYNIILIHTVFTLLHKLFMQSNVILNVLIIIMWFAFNSMKSQNNNRRNKVFIFPEILWPLWNNALLTLIFSSPRLIHDENRWRVSLDPWWPGTNICGAACYPAKWRPHNCHVYVQMCGEPWTYSKLVGIDLLKIISMIQYIIIMVI